jgi:anaerobic selenocysteine-containing dehydrogenase
MIATGNIDHAFVREWTNAPLLVRNDTARFLRERDFDLGSLQNRYAIWNATRNRVELVGEEADTVATDLALDRNCTVSFISGGRTATIQCKPAFELYKTALDEYTPERVEALTGVRAEDVVHVARMLAPRQRIAYHAWSGVGPHTNACQTERSIATFICADGLYRHTRVQPRVHETVGQRCQHVCAFEPAATGQSARAR